MRKIKVKSVFMISAIILMFSVTVAIISCMYMMQRAEAREEIAKDGTAEGLINMVQSGSSSVKDKEPTETAETVESTQLPKVEKVKGEHYTYYWSCTKDLEYTKPKDYNITKEDAISSALSALAALYGFHTSDKTNIDINFWACGYDLGDVYYVVLNNNYAPGRIIAEGEPSFICVVNGITGEVNSTENRTEEDSVSNNDMVFRHDNQGNKLGWDYPSCFKDSDELKQLKEECKTIAEDFLIDSGLYRLDELTYIKTEAYKDAYPWRLQVFFEKGENIVTVTIYAENKTPFEYEVSKAKG